MARHAPGIGIDLPKVLANAAVMQTEMQVLRDRLRQTEVEGSSGGGAVRVKLGGDFILRDVVIEASMYEDGDPELMGELIQAAVNDAMRAAQELAASMLGGITAGGSLEGM